MPVPQGGAPASGHAVNWSATACRPRDCCAAKPRRDGTRLGGCVKTRVPWPDGRWGLVLIPVASESGELSLRAIAFGERHPPAPRRPSVYQVAHRRLHGA
jgi:hypothetical protein